MHLKDWKAKRAGGRMTVYGTPFIGGAPTKIVGVDTIVPGESPAGNPCCVATDKNGVAHTLYI